MTRIQVPTIEELVVLLLRLLAAQFVVGVLLAVPIAIVYLAFGLMFP
jgi:hypothetical protein